MKRLLLLVLLTSLVGAGCFAGLRAPSRTTSRTTAAQDVEVIDTGVGIVGTLRAGADSLVTVTRSGESVRAETEMEVAYGDTIKVSEGTATLSYVGTGVSELSEGTTLTLEFPTLDEPEEDGDDSLFVRLKLTAGSVWTRLERLLGDDESFEVSGNSVVATVRGTAFSFGLDGAEDVDIDVAESEIDVVDEDAPGERIRVKPGEKFRANIRTLREAKAAAPTALRERFVRALKTDEKQRVQFVAMQKKIREEFLKRSVNPIHHGRRPLIRKEMFERLTPRQKEIIIKRLKISRVQAEMIRLHLVPNPLLPQPIQFFQQRLQMPTDLTRDSTGTVE